MRRTTTLTALALTTALLTGAAALPAQAAERPAAPASSAAPAAREGGPEAAGKSVTVSVSMDQLGRGRAITDALRSINTDDRGAFVQKAVDKAFEAAGGWHNVMLFNLSHNYDDRFRGTRLYANVTWGNVHYGLWVFESGEFTNHGDGGWINWGFRGWYERNGGHVKFNRSW
ncbi:stress protein [Streptomyces sp. MRC013]|uniref:stress protein n=1 Tax=Streptomyces sp. MRC013 TaxID=2898276 RepID=UPI002026F600|nr:stress protein [Streptomyces sp. MRC013]URM89850.1 stress protein [Streptomyces sp. MRC013]